MRPEVTELEQSSILWNPLCCRNGTDNSLSACIDVHVLNRNPLLCRLALQALHGFELLSEKAHQPCRPDHIAVNDVHVLVSGDRDIYALVAELAGGLKDDEATTEDIIDTLISLIPGFESRAGFAAFGRGGKDV